MNFATKRNFALISETIFKPFFGLMLNYFLIKFAYFDLEPFLFLISRAKFC